MTAEPRPFQFLVGVRGILDRGFLVDRSRIAESVGFSGLTVHDHLAEGLAPVPVLTAVAMATERLRLYPLVLNNDLRHPAVVAQELATLDVLSAGRVVVGIGAGWNATEYFGAGIPFDPPGIRIERMQEAIGIIRGLFGVGPVTTAGRHYTIRAMEGIPKPVQRPHPPFLIGGTRERILRLAAREANIVGVDLRQDRASLPDAFAPRLDTRIGWLREAAGPRFQELDINAPRVIGALSVSDAPLRVAREIARQYETLTGLTIQPSDILESPYSLIGSVSELVDKLRHVRERWGINSYLVGWLDEPTLLDFAPVVEQLAAR
jgi:probable F420-dependent oxidoreductase